MASFWSNYPKMTSQYYIDGPVNIGTTSQTTTIDGNIVLADTTTSAGDMVYANGSNVLQRLAVTNAGVMVGTSTAPSWLPPGSNNQVLTMVTGSPQWASPQSDSSQYGFMVTKSGTSLGPFTTTVISNWNTGPYTDPQYDATGGDFNATTGVFTVPGTTSDKSRWEVNAGITFTQSSNNNNTISDVHNISVLLNGTPLNTVAIAPGPRNGNLSVLYAPIDINFEAKGTDQISIRITCSNGGNVSIIASPNTFFGLVKLANA